MRSRYLILGARLKLVHISCPNDHLPSSFRLAISLSRIPRDGRTLSSGLGLGCWWNWRHPFRGAIFLKKKRSFWKVLLFLTHSSHESDLFRKHGFFALFWIEELLTKGLRQDSQENSRGRMERPETRDRKIHFFEKTEMNVDGLSQCFQKFQYYYKQIPLLFFIDFAPSKEIEGKAYWITEIDSCVLLLLLQGKKERN